MRYFYRHYIVFGNASANIAILGECVARILAVREQGADTYAAVDASFFVENRGAVDHAFWKFHDAFYESWEGANAGGLETLSFARDNFEVEAAELYSCAEKDTGENNPLEFVRRLHEAAEEFGVQSTPTVFANGVAVGWPTPDLLGLVQEGVAE